MTEVAVDENEFRTGTPTNPPEFVGRRECLETAAKCVMTDRNNTYGKPEDSFAETAKRWSITLGFEVQPHHVPMMLIDLKLARLRTSPQKADNWIDIAGYAACGSETAKAK